MEIGPSSHTKILETTDVENLLSALVYDKNNLNYCKDVICVIAGHNEDHWFIVIDDIDKDDSKTN